MKKFVFAIAMLVVPALSSAQTPVCTTPTLSGNINVPSTTFEFVICAPATADPDGIVVELNGVKSYTTKVADGPVSNGKLPYIASVTLPGRGTHTIKTAYFTLTSTGAKQESPLGVPFALVYEKAVPTVPPTNHPR